MTTEPTEPTSLVEVCPPYEYDDSWDIVGDLREDDDDEDANYAVGDELRKRLGGTASISVDCEMSCFYASAASEEQARKVERLVMEIVANRRAIRAGVAALHDDEDADPPPQPLDEVFELMTKVAAAVGDTFIIGVTAQGKWFAHCGGIEFDGEPGYAVMSVARDWRNGAVKKRVRLQEELTALEKIESVVP